MNVLQVIPYFAERRGGDVNACLNVSKQLIARGHDVTILTTDFELDQSRIDVISDLGVHLHPFHCAANLYYLLISPGMGRWIERNINAFDIVHLHDFRTYQNSLAHRDQRLQV